MKIVTIFLLIAIPLLAFPNGPLKLKYEVDITKIEADSFYVTLHVEGIKSDSIIFQFASTAPGIYTVIDAGRFVGNFQTFDKQGNLLNTKRLNINQILITNSCKLNKITYSVEDTYDSKIIGNPVMTNSGSNIENDNAVINAQVVCGYFHGYQKNPINIKFIYPKDWNISTALPISGDSYLSEDYDCLVDSPVMLGDLTLDKFNIDGATVEVSCYSQSKVITATQIAEKLKPYVEAVSHLLGEMPIKRYVFIYNFKKVIEPWALEHNYSSYHTFPEAPINSLLEFIVPVSTHEFCHIVTPLHIQSDIINQFNFAVPTPTANIWFYEGFVEWMSRIAIVRDGLLSAEKFLKELSNNYSKYYRGYDTTMNLRQSSLTSYTNNFEWGAAYNRGCMLAILVDLQLLRLSDGKTGLIGVMKQLYKNYDTKKTFPDACLIDIISKTTYSQIGEMLNKYVNGIDELPVGDFMDKVGCEYNREFHTGRYKGYARKWILSSNGSDCIVDKLVLQDSLVIQLGIKEGDKIKKLFYKEDEIPIYSPLFFQILDSVDVGVPITWVVERDGKEFQLKALTRKEEVVETHAIHLLKNPTPEQLWLRKRWLSNL